MRAQFMIEARDGKEPILSTFMLRFRTGTASVSEPSGRHRLLLEGGGIDNIDAEKGAAGVSKPGSVPMTVCSHSLKAQRLCAHKSSRDGYTELGGNLENIARGGGINGAE